MADVYTRFRNEGDYYDITGTQPPTAFADVPASAQTVAVQQGGGVPMTRRVLDVGRNDYNMQGTLEAAQRYGIPPVMVQSSPYARTAYTYGPSGPIPLIGATSVYPHVVSSGMYDYAAPYRRTVVPVGGSLTDIMAHIERMQRMRPRVGGTGGGASSAASPAPRQDSRGLKQSDPGEDAINQPLPDTGTTPSVEETSAPAPAPVPSVPVDGGTNYDLYPGIGMQDDIDAIDEVATFRGPSEAEFIARAQSGPGFLDTMGQLYDRAVNALRNMPRNVKPGRAPERAYPVAPEASQPMLAPEAVPVPPSVQPYLVPQPTLSSYMTAPMGRRRGPSILIG